MYKIYKGQLMKLTKYSLALLSAFIIFTGCGGGGGDTGSQPSTAAALTINEVLADNNSTNQDPDFNEYGDWIELKNSSDSDIALAGYGLSDKKSEIKWTFPANANIGANSSIIVWADDHNTSAKDNHLNYHTNFKLSAKGDNVVLFSPNGTQLEEVAFNTQRADISWAKNANGEFVLTAQPTPAANNVINEKTISKKPIFDKPEGVYTSTQTVTLTAPAGSKIYYTIDGSTPTIALAAHDTPTTITVATNTEIKSVSKEAGDSKLVSKVRSRWYVISTDPLQISEVLPENNSTKADENRNFGDIISLSNTNGTDLSLNGYGLGDSFKGAKWNFPATATVTGNSEIQIWADDLNTTAAPYHTNFKLNAKGDSVVLYKNNTIVDFVKFDKIDKDMSLNRENNGSYSIKTPTL